MEEKRKKESYKKGFLKKGKELIVNQTGEYRSDQHNKKPTPGLFFFRHYDLCEKKARKEWRNRAKRKMREKKK